MEPKSQKSRVLIIDDEDILKLAKIMISYMGYEVTTDNLSVFDKLAEGNYDLLLLDIQMPNMDGFEICRRVRKGVSKDIKIVLFTASADVDVINKGNAAGADKVFSKPFSIVKIKETIRNTLENEGSPELNPREQFSQVYAP